MWMTKSGIHFHQQAFWNWIGGGKKDPFPKMTWLRATFWLVWEPVRIKSSTHWTRNWHRLFYAHAISCTVIASDKWSRGCSLIQLNSYKNTPILTLITMTA